MSGSRRWRRLVGRMDGRAWRSGHRGGHRHTIHRAPRMKTVDVRCLDIRSHDLPPGEFDLVHARLVLEHLPDRTNILRKLAQKLRPGGWIVIEDYEYSCYSLGDQPYL